jgi:transcriptional regulator with XRE-family HTH domain
MIKPEQIRAARALLRLDQRDVAQRAQVSVATLRRLEAENGVASVAPSTLSTVQRTLEAAGVEFIPDGVRRRHSRTPEEKEALYRDIMAIADRVAALSKENPGFSEEDLYDESGLPA